MTRSTAVAIVGPVLLVAVAGLLLCVDMGGRKSEHKSVVLTRSGPRKMPPRSRPSVERPDRRVGAEEELEGREAPAPESAGHAAAPEVPSVTRDGARSEEREVEGGEPDGREMESEQAGRRLAIAREGSSVAAEGTHPLVDEGVESDPVTGALRFPPGARLVYPDAGGIDPGEGAVAFWIRKEWAGDEQRARSLLELRTDTWENRLELGLGPAYLRFLLTTKDGIETPAGASVAWQPDEWHHVTISWGQALMALYIDGKIAEQQTYAEDMQLPAGTPLYIASSRLPGDLPEGTVSLREFVVLDHRPDDQEIGALLMESAPAE
jgi:hypothetical protein